jgi:hypothetical protein
MDHRAAGPQMQVEELLQLDVIRLRLKSLFDDWMMTGAEHQSGKMHAGAGKILGRSGNENLVHDRISPEAIGKNGQNIIASILHLCNYWFRALKSRGEALPGGSERRASPLLSKRSNGNAPRASLSVA